MDLEHIGNIPVSTSAIASLFTNIEAGNQKVRSLEAAHKIIRLKKGLYVVAPNVSRVALSTELIANHLYAPSYVSMQTALRYYGLIPEAVYTTSNPQPIGFRGNLLVKRPKFFYCTYSLGITETS